jgi:hypothetical protein
MPDVSPVLMYFRPWTEGPERAAYDFQGDRRASWTIRVLVLDFVKYTI